MVFENSKNLRVSANFAIGFYFSCEGFNFSNFDIYLILLSVNTEILFNSLCEFCGFPIFCKFCYFVLGKFEELQ